MVAGIEASEFIKFCESHGGKAEIKSSTRYICKIKDKENDIEIELIEDGLDVKLTAMRSEGGLHPEYIVSRLYDPVCKIEQDLTGSYNLECRERKDSGYLVKVYMDGWYDLTAMLDKYEEGTRYPLARVILKKQEHGIKEPGSNIKKSMDRRTKSFIEGIEAELEAEIIEDPTDVLAKRLLRELRKAKTIEEKKEIARIAMDYLEKKMAPYWREPW